MHGTCNQMAVLYAKHHAAVTFSQLLVEVYHIFWECTGP